MSDNSVYHLYKPLRNHLRQVNTLESLSVLRAYVQHLQFGENIPRDIELSHEFISATNWLEKYVYEWELDILAKEIIANGQDYGGTKSLKSWKYFRGAINKLKDLENNIAIEYRDFFQQNILLELHRIAHRQFPWQTRPNAIQMVRYYKIFSNHDIDAIIQRVVGLTTKELYVIGLAFTGVYLKYYALYYPPDLTLAGITQKKLDCFLNRFSCDLSTIKRLIIESQSFNYDYAYTFNPLRSLPLLRVVWNGRDSVIAPIPTFLFRRITEGIFFEICGERDFGVPFGTSFQSYVGEMLHAANDDKMKVYPEMHYGKPQKDSVDWIVDDSSAALFVECKTKKLRFEAKISLVDTVILEEDLDKIADAVVQVYKTIRDYRNNLYPHFLYNPKKRIYPLIVTLEDWYAFGDKIVPEIDKRIKTKIQEENIDLNFFNNMPYSICSCEEFEQMIQIIQTVGVEKFMENKLEREKRLWSFSPFMKSQYTEELNKVKNLFPNDYQQIYPNLNVDK